LKTPTRKFSRGMENTPSLQKFVGGLVILVKGADRRLRKKKVTAPLYLESGCIAKRKRKADGYSAPKGLLTKQRGGNRRDKSDGAGKESWRGGGFGKIN